MKDHVRMNPHPYRKDKSVTAGKKGGSPSPTNLSSPNCFRFGFWFLSTEASGGSRISPEVVWPTARVEVPTYFWTFFFKNCMEYFLKSGSS